MGDGAKNRGAGVAVRDGGQGFRFADTPLLLLGHRAAPVDLPGWDQRCESGDTPMIAFPYAPLRVRFESDEPTMLTAATVATLGARHEYVRRPTCERGEATTFFRFKGDTMVDLAAEHDPHAADRPERPVPWCVSPVDPVAGAMVRRVAARVFEDACPADRVWVEESLIAIARRTMRGVFAMRGRGVRVEEQPDRLHAEAVRHVCAHVAEHYGEPLGVGDLAAIAGYTPGHFCRIFKRLTGMPMHKYLTIVRVMGAIDRIPERRGHLARLAHECGFANHAHLTSVFGRLIGAAPTAIDTDGLQWARAGLGRAIDGALPGARGA